MTDLPLASEFPAATRDQWLALVESVLKGADFDRKLVSRTYDGLRIEPLYPKAAGAVTRPGCAGTWRISQRIDHPDPAQRMRSRSPISKAAPTVSFCVTPAGAGARGFGVGVDTL